MLELNSRTAVNPGYADDSGRKTAWGSEKPVSTTLIRPTNGLRHGSCKWKTGLRYIPRKENHMSLAKMLTRKAVSAQTQDSLADVARLMKTENVGAVVITEKTRPVGIVTDRDLAFAVCTGGCSPEDEIQSVMTCPVETIQGDEGVYNATQKMMDLAVRRLPVVNYMGALIGLVSLDDLLLLLSRELHQLAEGIHAETQGAPIA
jgi:CBS domain-containing protein